MMIKTRRFELAAYAAGDPNSGKAALILPGRLDTKDYAHMTSHVDFLASRGYYALAFDPPGTWESPGGISLYTTTNYLQCIHELIDTLGNRPTILVGHSRGGSMAMLAGTQNPHVTHFAAVMSTAGPTRVGLPEKEGDAVTSRRDLPPGMTRTEEKQEFQLPYSYFQDQSQYDATEALKVCSKPKLFFYGTDDALISPETIQDIYTLSAAPKYIHELRTEHDYRLDSSVINEVNRTLDSFLEGRLS